MGLPVELSEFETNRKKTKCLFSNGVRDKFLTVVRVHLGLPVELSEFETNRKKTKCLFSNGVRDKFLTVVRVHLGLPKGEDKTTIHLIMGV